MISIDMVAIGTPVAYFVFLGLLGFVEYRWIERAKRREQLAMAARELPAPDAAQSANPDSRPAVKTQTAAE
ncbi:hypothetical protein [Bradyrhizobium sp.]